MHVRLSISRRLPVSSILRSEPSDVSSMFIRAFPSSSSWSRFPCGWTPYGCLPSSTALPTMSCKHKHTNMGEPVNRAHRLVFAWKHAHQDNPTSSSCSASDASSFTLARARLMARSSTCFSAAGITCTQWAATSSPTTGRRRRKGRARVLLKINDQLIKKDTPRVD